MTIRGIAGIARGRVRGGVGDNARDMRNCSVLDVAYVCGVKVRGLWIWAGISFYSEGVTIPFFCLIEERSETWAYLHWLRWLSRASAKRVAQITRGVMRWNQDTWCVFLKHRLHWVHYFLVKPRRQFCLPVLSLSQHGFGRVLSDQLLDWQGNIDNLYRKPSTPMKRAIHQWCQHATPVFCLPSFLMSLALSPTPPLTLPLAIPAMPRIVTFHCT